jgi:PadR family transcriptional regulator, regulatory protein PadR
MEELARHGYRLGAGTIYPILHGLEKAGYLARDRRVVEGKVRQTDRATDAGREALANARAKLRELVDEVLEESSYTSWKRPSEAGIEPR